MISISVSAFPAVELLWHDADSVDVRLGSYHPTASRLGDLLAETSGVGSLHVHVGTLHSGLLTVHDATLSENGGRLSASAQVYESDLRAAIPALQSVVPAASANGAAEFKATGSLLGLSATVNFQVVPSGGAIVAAGTGLLSAVRYTVWHDPRVHVDSVSGRPTSQGMVVAATAHLN